MTFVISICTTRDELEIANRTKRGLDDCVHQACTFARQLLRVECLLHNRNYTKRNSRDSLLDRVVHKLIGERIKKNSDILKFNLLKRSHRRTLRRRAAHSAYDGSKTQSCRSHIRNAVQCVVRKLPHPALVCRYCPVLILKEFKSLSQIAHRHCNFAYCANSPDIAQPQLAQPAVKQKDR